MKSLNSIKTLCGVAALVVAAGCGASVPMELASARDAVGRVSAGPTSSTNPAGLHTAKQTLAAAEHYYEEEGDTQETRDLAYTAERRAQTAEAKGREIGWTMAAEQLKKQMEEAEAARLASTSQELQLTKEQLAQQSQMLADERARRAEAEKRAAEAAEMLAKFATVKQESRGMVITLSGNVLFETNKSKLFPAAEVKLNDVAKALTQQDPDSKIVIEGHADAQGDDAHNMELSQSRAEAVRQYFIERGIAADRIIAKGYGETRPIADNNSPEGRANNRRVEIVVQSASETAAMNSGSASSAQPEGSPTASPNNGSQTGPAQNNAAQNSQGAGASQSATPNRSNPSGGNQSNSASNLK